MFSLFSNVLAALPKREAIKAGAFIIGILFIVGIFSGVLQGSMATWQARKVVEQSRAIIREEQSNKEAYMVEAEIKHVEYEKEQEEAERVFYAAMREEYAAMCAACRIWQEREKLCNLGITDECERADSTAEYISGTWYGDVEPTCTGIKDESEELIDLFPCL